MGLLTEERDRNANPSRSPGRFGDFSDIPFYEEPRGTFVSLYAGAGGMDLGFALAGFRPVWVNEFDVAAAQTHEALFEDLAKERPHLQSELPGVNSSDLLDIPPTDLPIEGSADLVIGGPPCQGFSVAGKMDPHDQRSRHVFHFLDLVDRVKPKAFVMENVKALFLNQRFSLVRDRLRARADELGYSAEMFLLDSSHFGVPQARERMVFIGVRDGSPIAPTPTTQSNPPTLRQVLADLPPLGQPGNDSLCRAKVTPAVTPVLRKSPYAGMLFNGAGRPMDLDAPAPTLPASMGGNKTPIIDQQQLEDGSDPWIVGYHEHLIKGRSPRKTVPRRMRRITVQEAAAIQTFPHGMRWQGSQSAQYRQIGNAVPPRLAYAVASSIAAQLTPEG